ncbi:hypothetical protein MVEN_00189500 [Mycena venus]|uniref:F-box domain-containing protein n=1 Tax=Mycena venus TaxID=2733690 RepID=A0A8H7DDZ3_9AGAR|nr:hypothetical protein MVEN_00189500 [Mycena venus]
MASPFASQLGSGYCPSNEEILQIKELLIEPTLRMKELDDEIAALQKAIDKLRGERDGLCTYVDAHKALISPVRRLSLDIIEQIFIACLPTHRNCAMSASEAPVLLGRICGSWRTISLSMPRLWSRLHIVQPNVKLDGTDGIRTPMDDSEKLDQRLESTKMWLGRSGQCPLSISVEGVSEPRVMHTATPSPPRSTLLLQALVPFASRWQHIHITADSSAFNAMSHLVEGDVPMLETLSIRYSQSIPHREVRWEQLGIFGGARLCSLSMPGRNFQDNLPLRWHQLTVLEIVDPYHEFYMHIERILRIISRCPELRICKLPVENAPHGGGVWLPHPAIELKLLETLELHCKSSPESLLDRLSLPELRSFSISGFSQNTPSLIPVFILWTRLETVRINSMLFNFSLLELLQNLPPTIRRLHLDDKSGTFLDDDVLAVFTPAPGGSAPCCPALEALIMDQCPLISDAAVLRFITARMNQSSLTLKRLKIHFRRLMTLDILPSLQPFIDAGLEVSLHHTMPQRVSPWQGLPDTPPSPPD